MSFAGGVHVSVLFLLVTFALWPLAACLLRPAKLRQAAEVEASDAVLHRIHLQVLGHLQNLAEQGNGTQ